MNEKTNKKDENQINEYSYTDKKNLIKNSL